MGQRAGNPDGSSPLRDRQETFAQLRATGLYSAAEAYRLAGYAKTNPDVGAAKLVVRDSIVARIAWIKAALAKKKGVTQETLADEYDEALAMGREQGHPSAMVAATTGKARLYGFDKQVIEQSAPEPMSRSEQEQADEWAEFKLWKSSQTGPRVVDIKEGVA